MIGMFRSTTHGRDGRVTFLAVCLTTFLSVTAAFGETSRPPNIVLIISDDHGWSDYGFMGHEHVRTPHLDRLASQSLTFKRGYVPSSLCCPSSASLITGQYPHQHKVTSNDPPLPKGAGRKHPDFAKGRERMNRFMDEAPSLPRLLQQKGYLSFQTGKWWQGDFTRGGFTHGMTKGERHGDAGLDIGRKTTQPVYDFIDDATKQDKPFLVWYAPMLPHSPHNPPERLLAKYADKTPSKHVAKYWAMIEWFDETCGALLDRLDNQGVADNTIVVYVADNGWIQQPDAGAFDPRSKRSPYEGGIRTPIMVRWPGKVKPRMAEDDLAISIDIAPTLLRAAGVGVPPSMPGVNLLDDGAATKSRPAIFGECFTHEAVDLDDPASSLENRWVIAGNWKLIAPHAPNRPGAKPELYDLSNDPAERNDLAAKDPARVATMLEQLDSWWIPKI